MTGVALRVRADRLTAREARRLVEVLGPFWVVAFKPPRVCFWKIHLGGADPGRPRTEPRVS